MMEAEIKPVLSVKNGVSAVEFYRKVFEATEIMRVEGNDGSIVAELLIGKSGFFVADESPENANFSPLTIGGNSIRMALTVDNPDIVFNKALDAGATSIYPVADQSYGYRLGRLSDPFGHHWEIGKPI